jgi:hypothetical protein
MRSGRLYPVAVILMIGAILGVVSLGWGDLIATGSGAKRTLESKPSPAVGGEGKQTPLLMRVLNSPQPVKGSDGKYHLVY